VDIKGLEFVSKYGKNLGKKGNVGKNGDVAGKYLLGSEKLPR
jgi:hypothetical protein